MSSTKNTHIIVRFAIIYFFVLLGFGLVVKKIITIQQVEKDEWMALSDSLRKVSRVVEVEPSRGNIFSDSGELMASTVPTYYLYMDMMTPALRLDDGALFWGNIDSLSLCLSQKMGDKTKTQYRVQLITAFKQKKRHFRISRKRISHADYKDVKQFPIFRLGSRGGLVARKMVKRIKPYGSLAAVTVGDLYAEKGKGAKYGIEAAFDEYLKGKPGRGHIERKAGVNILVNDIAPENGADITTTLNVDMQDIAEKALRQKITQIDADKGAVILMEVGTGKIKALVNLTRIDKGDFRELESIALPSNLEPGSTFKIPALMAALEDGVVKPDDEVDCGDGTWQLNEEVLITDHNTGEKANGVIPVPQVIVRSSNVGMAKLIYEGYKDKPEKYIKTLHRMGVGMPIDIGFKGVAEASILGPDENPLWAPSDLASMAYGYSVNMPLLYTLTFYNAIANDGRMMSPYLVKKITKEGKLIQEFEPKVMENSICSSKTLKIIKNMMLQVVEDPHHATGKPARSKYVRIAGKTGTARYGYNYSEGRNMNITRHRVFFCGFFPYENPKYTCIVYMQNPRVGGAAGGSMAGPVFKEIAERVMASSSTMTVEKFVADSNRVINPYIAAGQLADLKVVAKTLKLKTEQKPKTNWIKVRVDSNNVFQIEDCEMIENLVPNVVGMGLKDAIYLLERNGLRTAAIGRGRVRKQSIRPGVRINKGDKIYLELR